MLYIHQWSLLKRYVTIKLLLRIGEFNLILQLFILSSVREDCII